MNNRRHPKISRRLVALSGKVVKDIARRDPGRRECGIVRAPAGYRPDLFQRRQQSQDGGDYRLVAAWDCVDLYAPGGQIVPAVPIFVPAPRPTTE
jgi:hypothetical protein